MSYLCLESTAQLPYYLLHLLRVVYGTLMDCTALQTVNTRMDLWDFLPHDLFMAEVIQSQGDLDEIMVSICLSISLLQLCSVHCSQ